MCTFNDTIEKLTDFFLFIIFQPLIGDGDTIGWVIIISTTSDVEFPRVRVKVTEVSYIHEEIQ